MHRWLLGLVKGALRILFIVVSIIITRSIVINVVKGLLAKCYRDFEVVPGTGTQWITAKWTEAVLESAHTEDDQQEVPDNHSDNDVGCDTSRTVKNSL